MYIWKQSDVILIYRKEFGKVSIYNQGNETYAFLMSGKYIMALYTHCLVERKKTAFQEIQIEGFTEKEYGMVRLESVLLRTLLFDYAIEKF